MSASSLNDKNQAFNRLLHDLHHDSIHIDMEEEREHLPLMAQSASLSDLRGKLRQRYRRSRISPTQMYLPRVALTACILLTCAVTYLYINRLKELKFQEEKRKEQQKIELDSLIRNRNHIDEKKY
jgi:hypothetical protein